MFEYEPSTFLRCHSRKTDPLADLQTQVWHATFEPSLEISCTNTNKVATCGGNSVCLIDVNEGQVIKKYYSSKSEEFFYCCEWASVPFGSLDYENILVAGSSLGKIHIICPRLNITLAEISLVAERKKTSSNSVSSLCIYKDLANNQVLLCGLGYGGIKVVEITISSAKECETSILETFSLDTELFQIAYCPTTQMILAACDGGLRGLHVPSFSSLKKDNLKVTKFELVSNLHKEGYTLVDTVQIIGNGLISVKYALHEAIYVIDLKVAAENHSSNKSSECLQLTPSYVLKWSNTDNYFMSIGISKKSNLLACGDDVGAIWLYNIDSLGNGRLKTPQIIEPVKKIEWPKVKDIYSDKKRKLNLGVYDIVIDKVAIHSSGKYLVAVTNNNTVCIWRRVNS